MIIPGSSTKLLQLLDISVNKSFKVQFKAELGEIDFELCAYLYSHWKDEQSKLFRNCPLGL